MALMDKEIIEYADIFAENRRAMISAFPEMYHLSLVLNKPRRKALTKKLNRSILKGIGQ